MGREVLAAGLSGPCFHGGLSAKKRGGGEKPEQGAKFVAVGLAGKVCCVGKQGVPQSTSRLDAFRRAPRGSSLAVKNVAEFAGDELEAVAAALNSRPRKTLGWKTPAEVLRNHLGSTTRARVATIS